MYNTVFATRRPTDESKDVPNGGDEDDEEVAPNQQSQGDDDVTDPAETFSSAAEQVIHRGTDLSRHREDIDTQTSCSESNRRAELWSSYKDLRINASHVIIKELNSQERG